MPHRLDRQRHLNGDAVAGPGMALPPWNHGDDRRRLTALLRRSWTSRSRGHRLRADGGHSPADPGEGRQYDRYPVAHGYRRQGRVYRHGYDSPGGRHFVRRLTGDRVLTWRDVQRADPDRRRRKDDLTERDLP